MFSSELSELSHKNFISFIKTIEVREEVAKAMLAHRKRKKVSRRYDRLHD